MKNRTLLTHALQLHNTSHTSHTQIYPTLFIQRVVFFYSFFFFFHFFWTWQRKRWDCEYSWNAYFSSSQQQSEQHWNSDSERDRFFRLSCWWSCDLQEAWTQLNRTKNKGHNVVSSDGDKRGCRQTSETCLGFIQQSKYLFVRRVRITVCLENSKVVFRWLISCWWWIFLTKLMSSTCPPKKIISMGLL